MFYQSYHKLGKKDFVVKTWNLNWQVSSIGEVFVAFQSSKTTYQVFKLMPLLKVRNILEGALLDIETIGSGVIIIVLLLRRVIDKGKSENRETKLKWSISKQRQRPRRLIIKPNVKQEINNMEMLCEVIWSKMWCV